MIVTDAAVFLQLPKCASTSLQFTLKQRFHGRSFGKHSRIEIAPQEAVAGKPIVGGIRDPLSWYLSLWQFGCLRKGIHWKTATAPVVPGVLPAYVKARFKHAAVTQTADNYARHIDCEACRDPTLWQELYADPNDIAAFRRWLELIHVPRHQFVCFPDYGYAAYREEAGLFTHVFLQLYTKYNDNLYKQGPSSLASYLNLDKILPNRLIRQASFADDFVWVLKETNHDVSAELEAEIKKKRKVNVSGSQLNRSDFYDQKSREFVLSKDRLLYDQFTGQFRTLLFGAL